MSLQTNLLGRLRNTDLPKSHALLPVFETVVNSIHALEERGNLTTTGQIVLKIQRVGQLQFAEAGTIPTEIRGFIIEDNGIGFNDANMQSFQTLDSDHKIDKGCRGVGRLLWLKAFTHIEINSVFEDSQNNFKSRTIGFDAKNGVKLLQESNSDNIELKT
ncbi:MAG: hypothetical protein PHT85_15050, partial [Methylovulum sp.]|nr:hypothetical protein [Methylovulum sp.]